MNIFTKTFLASAVERAIKTACQSALLVLGADQINVITADWGAVAGFAAGGFVLSLLTSIGSGSVDIGGYGPSLANEHTVPHDI